MDDALMLWCLCVSQSGAHQQQTTKQNSKMNEMKWNKKATTSRISAAHVNWPEYIQNARTALRSNMYNIKFDVTTYEAILAYSTSDIEVH